MWKLKSLLKPLAILSILCLFSLGAIAQGTVKGTVIDEAGEPVIGASVQVQGAKTRAVTDFNGNFSVQAANHSERRGRYRLRCPEEKTGDGCHCSGEG